MRLVPVVLAIALNLGLAAASGAPSLTLLHPVAPPLTHIPAMGEQTLAPPEQAPRPGEGLRWGIERVVDAVGTSEQREQVATLRAARNRVPALVGRGMRLRLEVQADAEALAEAVGGARTEAFLAHREQLSVTMGEARVWVDATARAAP